MYKRSLKYALARIRHFLRMHFSQRAIVLLLSVVIGVLGAAAAIIIKNLLFFTTQMLSQAFPMAKVNYLYLIFPPIGILLTLLFVRRCVRDNLSHGVSIVLKAICKSDGKLRLHNVYSSMISSAITVGFGGSVGLEAPMVLTGSAIGSNLGRFFRLNAKQTTLLLACGSASAMAAIFKAPIAAIVFTFEVLMLDLTGTAILPLLISAVTGTVMSLLFLGNNVMFNINATKTFFLSNIPLYILLGVLCGLISVYFLRVSRWMEKQMKRIRMPYVRALLGGLGLCMLIFLFPVFYGEGYESISQLLKGGMQNYTVFFKGSPLAGFFSNQYLFLIGLACIILFKVFATTFTTAAGGIGGVFAPTLFIGAYVGFLVAVLAQMVTGHQIPYVNFILAGMAGIMAGVMQAPMTAIFLIAELSTGYNLLIPLMVTSAFSYLCVHPFETYSVYTRPLAEKGDLKTHNKDKFALRKLDWHKLIDHDIKTIPLHSTLREYVQTISNSKRNIFVVIDKEDTFAGLLVMDDHRETIFKQELYDLVRVDDLMMMPDTFLYDEDTATVALEKFNKTGNFNMPVITKDRKYVGFVNKTHFLAEYQRFVASESED